MSDDDVQFDPLCRWCGQQVTRFFAPDGSASPSGATRLVAGAWFHTHSRLRHCMGRSVAVAVTEAEPTIWEVDREGH